VFQKARDLTQSIGIVLLHLLQHIVGEECKTGDGAHSFQEAALVTRPLHRAPSWCAVAKGGERRGGLTMKIPQTGLGVARRLVMPWKAQAGQRMRQAFSRKMETRLKREPHHLIKCRRASSFNRLAVMGSYQIRHHRPDAVVRDARRSNSF